MDAPLRKTIPFFEEARPLWAVLQRCFDVGSCTHKQQLKAALGECKQMSTMSVAEYFEKLQPLWDELATYNHIPCCTCGSCACGLAQDPLPTLDRDYHTLLQEESLRGDTKNYSDKDLVKTMVIQYRKWQKLLSLLGNYDTTSASRLTGKFPVSSWIIDTGASSHVTGDLSLLSHISSMCHVGLLDGQITSATKCGRVRLYSIS
ncbi:hypothetical protein LIER_28280 [Lithospermum erythrorhizon]|uniref:Retrotransposon gag domain-containing protein n=1 Tax=Lithospermum erythrorhizon TaxID=34254 RepID=A0AAV3RI45_LITER